MDYGSGLGLQWVMLLHQVIDGALQYGVWTHKTLCIKHCGVWYKGNFFGESCYSFQEKWKFLGLCNCA